jgi:transcription initiation factor TFIID TATA-box-binding protein
MSSPDAPEGTISVENVVASATAGQELDLETLSVDLPGAEYNPDRFPGLIYRQTEPKSSTLLFRSGKIVSTGAQSVDDVKAAVHGTLSALEDLGIPTVDDPELTVQNIVSSADLGQRLNLNATAIGLGLEAVEYEPEQFPGLVYRSEEPDTVALLFGSGKCVITGATDLTAAEESLASVRTELSELGVLD